MNGLTNRCVSYSLLLLLQQRCGDLAFGFTVRVMYCSFVAQLSPRRFKSMSDLYPNIAMTIEQFSRVIRHYYCSSGAHNRGLRDKVVHTRTPTPKLRDNMTIIRIRTPVGLHPCM